MQLTGSLHARIVPIVAGATLAVVALQAQSAPPHYKGIWEPVNYPADVVLKDVYFVNDRVGWIAGGGTHKTGGFILHTVDAGEHWEIQVGNPKSADPSMDQLRFIDQTHGWAVQRDGALLHTSDGKNWEVSGSLPKFAELRTYLFTSTTNGILLGGGFDSSTIYSTRDGGRSWNKNFPCVTTMQVEGLTKTLGCYFEDLAFPTARVGYAVGGGYNGGYAVVAKTEDGGASWRFIFASTHLDTIDAAFFTDQNHGVIRLRDRKILLTEDGGQTWRGAPGAATSKIKFSDPETGWSCLQRTCSYTTDAGRHWTSRDVRLPAAIDAFSAPRRDRVFLVGDHGMVYRYRIVRADYQAQGIVGAPLLPAYGSPVTAQLETIRAKALKLQAKLGSAGQGTAASAPGEAPAASDGFSQDASFPQDALNTPPSAAMQDCCGTQVVDLQSDLSTFSREVPSFSGRYRNLNLLFVGMNMLNDLTTKASGVRDAFLALKAAPNPQTAAAALQDLIARLDDTSQTVSSGFQNLSAGGSEQAAGGTAGNMLASPNAGGANSGAAGTSGAPPQNQAPNQAVDQAAGQVKDVLKKFIHF